ASNRASITTRDILAAPQRWQAPQNGYKCMSCCHIFSAMCLVKNHIQHSSQQGYSCKVFY
ncbi:SPT46 protein, partial [Odontophorus gujanensis]|nr:SPT46 protein [Odontophorus gujanensis]